MAILLRILTIPLVILLMVGMISACTCAGAPPGKCTMLQDNHGPVFLGTVISIDNPPTGRSGDEAGTATYHFRVDERFADIVTGEALVHSGRGGGDCSIWFKQGEQYLVFADRSDDGSLSAWLCSQTQPASGARPLLAELRAARDGQPIASLFGVLSRVQQPYDGVLDPDFNRVLPGVSLQFTGEKQTFRTKTDEFGVYRLYDVPEGDYKILADLPKNLELAYTVIDGPMDRVHVPAGACMEGGLEALPTGRIQGHVLGPDGKAIRDVGVELFRVGLYKEDATDGWDAWQDDEHGFVFKHVAAGDYLLVFGNNCGCLDTNAPFPRTFYPDAPVVSRAQVIHIEDGQQILNADIHLSGGLPTRQVTVRVIMDGGSGRLASLVTAKGSRGEQVYPQEIQPNVYRVDLLLDSDYTIDAQTLYCDPEMESDTVSVKGADRWVHEITLTVSGTACHGRPEQKDVIQ